MPTDDPQSIVITAVSAVTAVGYSAKTTCSALQAGVLPFEEHEYIRCTPEDPEWDEDLAPIVARAPFISPFTNDIGRFNDLAIPAITELFATSNLTRRALTHTGLFVALPEKDPSITHIGADTAWFTQLRKTMGLSATGSAKAENAGRCGVFTLINEAVQALDSGELEYCIVGGIDSYLFDHRIAQLDQQWRVKTARNVDGFIPGEAAAMLMLETNSHARSRGAKVLARIDGQGFGNEEIPLASSRASSGQGLSQAIRDTLAQSGSNGDIQSVHCSLNGESYFSYEWGLVQTRLGQQLANISELCHPADCVGEVGAAIGAVMIVNAINLIEQSDKKQSVLLFTANDDPGRAALVISAN